MKDTEIEAHGYGLFVAMMAVILMVMLGVSAILAPTIREIIEQHAQAEPATPHKPPAR